MDVLRIYIGSRHQLICLDKNSTRALGPRAMPKPNSHSNPSIGRAVWKKRHQEPLLAADECASSHYLSPCLSAPTYAPSFFQTLQALQTCGTLPTEWSYLLAHRSSRMHLELWQDRQGVVALVRRWLAMANLRLHNIRHGHLQQKWT